MPWVRNANGQTVWVDGNPRGPQVGGGMPSPSGPDPRMTSEQARGPQAPTYLAVGGPQPRDLPPGYAPTPSDRGPQTAPPGVGAQPYAHTGPTTGFSFGNLNNQQYNTLNDPANYAVGYQKLTDWANPNGSNSNYGSWLASQAGETRNRYEYESVMDPTQKLQWVDYLEKQAPGFRDMFQSLSSRQRGENPALYDSGVYLG